MTTQQKSTVRINRQITAPSVRLIDAQGQMIGVLPILQALAMAEQVGLDLVEVSPAAEPPVCKIQDFGKFRYEAQKKAHEARRKQKVVELKEIKLRVNIGEADYQVKLRSMQEFIAEGDKVKITLRFKGREVAHQELGMKLLQRILHEMAEETKVELSPRMEGRQMLMVLAPKG